jgi:hypothetical protein
LLPLSYVLSDTLLVSRSQPTEQPASTKSARCIGGMHVPHLEREAKVGLLIAHWYGHG